MTRAPSQWSPGLARAWYLGRHEGDQTSLSVSGDDGQASSADPGTAHAAAWKPILEWVPSQKGFFVDAPQRQSQILLFVGRMLPFVSRKTEDSSAPLCPTVNLRRDGRLPRHRAAWSLSSRERDSS
jgi:hypothetical protein